MATRPFLSRRHTAADQNRPEFGFEAEKFYCCRGHIVCIMAKTKPFLPYPELLGPRPTSPVRGTDDRERQSIA